MIGSSDVGQTVLFCLAQGREQGRKNWMFVKTLLENKSNQLRTQLERVAERGA